MERLGEGLWHFHYDVKMLWGAIIFQATTWIVRLENNTLALISPGPIDDNRAAEIAKLGNVSCLIAPNSFHHLFVKRAKERYPEATICIAPALETKRADLTPHTVLTRDPEPAWASTLDQVVIDGAPKLTEVLFFHKPSGSLLITDLMFNIHQTRGWLTPVIVRMFGAHKKLASSRLLKSQFQDRQAASASLREVFTWPIQSLQLNHGDAVRENALTRFRETLSWLPNVPQP